MQFLYYVPDFKQLVYEFYNFPTAKKRKHNSILKALNDTFKTMDHQYENNIPNTTFYQYLCFFNLN